MVCTNGNSVLKASGCQAVYTACEYLLRYITGFVAENGCVVIDGSGTTLYTDKRYIEAAEKILTGSEVKATLYTQKELLERLAKYETVGVSFDQTSHSEFVALEKAGVRMVNIDEKINLLMAIKNEWEFSNIRRACEIAEEAFLRLLPNVKEGMSETEVAALLEYNMRALGASGLSFETIVAFGAHAAVPHHETGDTRLKFGDEVLIDFGCRVNGYCSDITRTFLFGDDGKHEAFKKAYQA
ncbi:MAG: aminopeptidase P family protein, partial [Clostridia bacterium]|nr:aminopeptidase P family protein [Clostridia bacterium]